MYEPTPVLRRPKAGDTEEDLMRFQEQFVASNRLVRPAATVIVKRQSSSSCCTNSHLETVAEEAPPLLCNITETNIDYLSRQNLFVFPDKKAVSDCADETLLLSPLQIDDCNLVENAEDSPSTSIFAKQFDRLYKTKTSPEMMDCGLNSAAKCQTALDVDTLEQINQENDQKLRCMSEEEIALKKEELLKTLDANLIEFFKKRGARQVASCSGLSHSQSEHLELRAKDAERNIALKEDVLNLEVIEQVANNSTPHALQSENRRVASDPIALDLLSKCAGAIGERRERAIPRLFDALLLQSVVVSEKKDDEKLNRLLSEAITSMEAIKQVFLQTDGSDRVKLRANDGSWMLQPIREALDGVNVSLDRVRLCLLFALLLFKQRPTLFFASLSPQDVFCRISELFLLGPEYFLDETIKAILEILIREYFMVQIEKRRLQFQLETPVAGLDSFLPFYEDLLRRYEEWSYGDESFALVILIPCYCNCNLASATLLRLLLWAPDRQILLQQISLHYDSLLSSVEDDVQFQEKQNWKAYSKLLILYASAVSEKVVTKQRNGLLYHLAVNAMKCFLQRHQNDNVQSVTPYQKTCRLLKTVVDWKHITA